MRGQVGGVLIGQSAVALADGCAHCPDDDGFTHLLTPYLWRHGPSTSELRFALRGERRVGLRRVCCGEVAGLRAGLVGQRFAQCRGGAVVEQRLALRQRERLGPRPGGRASSVDERVDLIGRRAPR